MKRSYEMLQEHFERKKKANKNFSLRALARKLDLSPSYTSKLLRGLKPLPLNRSGDLARALSMDALHKRKLDRALLREQKWDGDTRANAALDVSADVLPSERFRDAEPGTFWLVEEWYYLPLIALCDCDDFTADIDAISARLGLARPVAEKAWSRLVEKGVVKNENGVWKKVQERMRFPNARQNSVIQRYYATMFEMSARLVTRAAPEEFGRRLIMGASVSTNEESYLAAKKYMEEALCRACEILDEGKRDRVYYLGVQLLPLTR